MSALATPYQAPGISSLKEIDDEDTRREIRICLEKLSIPQRIDFIYWCVKQCNRAAMFTGRNRCLAYSITGEYVETVMDVAMIHSHFGLDLQAVLAELERRASAAVKLWLPPG